MMEYFESRMESLKTTIKSDKFMDLPYEVQLLYVHLWLAQPVGEIVTGVWSLGRMIARDAEHCERMISLLEETGFIEPVTAYGYRVYDNFVAERKKDM